VSARSASAAFLMSVVSAKLAGVECPQLDNESELPGDHFGSVGALGQLLTFVNAWYGEANQCFSRHSVN